MKPRPFIRSLLLVFAALASAASGADGQQPGRVYRLGWLSPNTGPGLPGTAFRQAMRAHGYVEGKNLIIEERAAKEKIHRMLPALTAELVTLKPDCIVAVGTLPTRIVERATTTIPIVMANADDDPVRLGLVASFAHPGGNVTGFSDFGTDLSGKRLELLHDLIPGLTRVAILWQPNIPIYTVFVHKTEAAAATIGVKIERVPVLTKRVSTPPFARRPRAVRKRSSSRASRS